uniref:Uncharacterized protein n=1 Tax=Tanacetum cinerariifolium TaxID=118510 RepID=A0A6L2P7E4_TANCI|nr:hypothetical protein [Tanacetum cinerariifolium]
MTTDQQVALDEAFIPHASRLRIGKSNFRLRSDITFKESTLQLVYDVLRLTYFYKAFLVTADEILAFFRYLGLGGEIRKLTDVNINKLHQPWRSFAAVINKCLSGKSTGYNSLRLSQDPSIPRRNKVNWHYVRDDLMFTTIKLVSRHQNTQQFGAMLSVELTNKDIKNSAACKEYYAIASGEAPPKTKATKGKQPAKSSKAKDLSVLSEVAVTEAEQMKLATKRSLQQTHISQASGSDDDDEVDDRSDDQEDNDDQDDDDQDDDQDTDNDGDDFVHPKLSIHEEEAKDEERFNPIVQTPKNSNDEGIDSLFETTPWVDVQASTTVASLTLTAPTLPPLTIPTTSQVQQAPTPPTTAPIFRCDTHFWGCYTLEANFSEFVQTNQFARAVSSILEIVERYMDQWMNEAVKVVVQLQSDRLRDEAQAENKDFINKLVANIQKILKEQVKEQVKVQVSKILPRIEKTVNEQLESEVLTRSSNSSKTSYAVAADLSEMELKKILIEKIESNKSIHQSDEQRNLYKDLVDACECDKIILDTYGDTGTLKRRHDDADKDEEPSAGSDWGSKRKREGKEPESTSTPKEKTTKTTGKSTKGSKSHQKTASESAPVEEPMRQLKIWKSPHIKSLKQVLLMINLSQKLLSILNDTLTPELLAGLTYELMKGSCKSLVELEFFLEEVYKATTDQLDWNNPEGQQYAHNLLKPLSLIPNSRGHHVIPFDHFINNDLEYLRSGASSRKNTTSVTKIKAADYGHIKWIEDLIVEWHNYKHLDWITMRRDDDKFYKFKEGDFKKLHIQDIEDMLLLLVQGKLTNLRVEERFAFNVSLRMFTRSIVIQRRVEDLQLGVESYQKKLNLTKPDTYRSDLKRKEVYTAYSNPRGFIYQNKDKPNRLMQIDELHKFSDGTLNDV